MNKSVRCHWKEPEDLTLSFIHLLPHGAVHKGCSQNTHLCQLVRLCASQQDDLVDEIKVLTALVLKHE